MDVSLEVSSCSWGFVSSLILSSFASQSQKLPHSPTEVLLLGSKLLERERKRKEGSKRKGQRKGEEGGGRK